jgi:hypothetical protein
MTNDVESATTGELRDSILDALEQFYCPLTHQDIVAYVQVFHGIEISRNDVETLIHEERQSYDAGGTQPVWICPAILNYAGFAADDSLLTRSDWPLTARVVAAAGSEAIRRVWLTKRLCDLATIALEQARPGAEALVDAAAVHAELLLSQGILRARLYLLNEEAAAVPPFSELDWDVRLQFWAESAEDAHGDLANVDRAAREECADALGRMSPSVQLFGGARVP